MRILIVEDDIKIAGAMKRGLQQESYAIDIERDGDSGLAAAMHEPYDLIILDRMLPGGYDGVGIAQELRRNNKPVPIIMLTAKDAIADRVVGLDAGADDYLVKPFAFEELLARMRALLRRPSEQLNNTLSYADVQIDTAKRIVTRQGHIIDLTLKEYSLLVYLVRNAEQVVSKDQIMQHVWDFDADILPNTVEAYIGYLRGKVERPFKKSPTLIHTRRGFGYVLRREL